MRRALCEITEPEDLAAVLNAASVGRLATLDAEGYPYITPVNFIFYQGRIYFHGGFQGEKMNNLLRDPRVGFEVDLPLAYLGVDFNPERNPCRAHQFYHSVVIRGRAEILPDGQRKTEVLNALMAKHEGNPDFRLITPDSPGYRACRVIEIRPIQMTGKSELGQSLPQQNYRGFIARRLAERGLPGDLEAVLAMGYDPEQLRGSDDGKK